MEDRVNRSESVALNSTIEMSAQDVARRLVNTRCARVAAWRLYRATANRERQKGKLGLAVDRLNEALVEYWRRQLPSLPP